MDWLNEARRLLLFCRVFSLTVWRVRRILLDFISFSCRPTYMFGCLCTYSTPISLEYTYLSIVHSQTEG